MSPRTGHERLPRDPPRPCGVAYGNGILSVGGGVGLIRKGQE